MANDDKPSLNVVPLRDKPSLADIVGRLRLLADQIEKGELGEVDSCLVLIPRPDDYPIIRGFGDVEGRNEPMIQMQLGIVQFATKIMVRS